MKQREPPSSFVISLIDAVLALRKNRALLPGIGVPAILQPGGAFEVSAKED